MSTMCIYNFNVSSHDKIELRVGIGTGPVVAGEDDEHSVASKLFCFLHVRQHFVPDRSSWFKTLPVRYVGRCRQHGS